MNRKIIKDIFDKNINKNDIYNNVLKKKKINYWKYSLIPISIILLFYFININKENIKIVDTNRNIININELSDVANTAYDINWSLVEMAREEFFNEFKWCENIKVPIYLNQLKFNKIYNYFDNTKFTGDYLINYYNDDSSIEIFISPSSKTKPRCIQIIFEDLNESVINGISVKIVRYQENYIVLFTYNDFNFDIETFNINENELIELIESIIKENN
ncbi:MAG: hypothetical protein IJY25_00845 [Bacilli bacterium]|nr:hypothetical protein [Bacilli bacterium]